MSMRALICLAGELGDVSADELGTLDTVIAADSGIRHARQLGLEVDYVVGDFDSARPDDISTARIHGAKLMQVSSEKDLTDFEIAIAQATNIGATELTVVAGWGGRLDHCVGNLAALAAPAHSHLQRHFRAEHEWVSVLDDAAIEIKGRPGDVVSLFPFGGQVAAVTTTGLKYPLSSQPMSPYAALGVSNELLGSGATVAATGGALLVVHPRRCKYL